MGEVLSGHAWKGNERDKWRLEFWREKILEFAEAYDLTFVNTFYKNR